MTPGQRCPKCGGQQFLLIDPVRDSDCDAITSVHEMHVLACEDNSVLRTGHFRAEVCEGCGFTEWYVAGLDQGAVAAIMAHRNSNVRRVRS